MMISLNIVPWLHWLKIGALIIVLLVCGWRFHQSRSGKQVIQKRWLFVMVIGIQFGFIASHFFNLWYQYARSSFLSRFLPPQSHLLYGVVWRDLVTLLAGWVAAILLFLGLRYIFLQRGHGAMLDQSDVFFFTISAIMVGWPGILIFLAITFVLAVVAMLVLVVFRKKTITDRLVVTPYILPAAIITLFSGPYLLALTHLDKIRF